MTETIVRERENEFVVEIDPKATAILCRQCAFNDDPTELGMDPCPCRRKAMRVVRCNLYSYDASRNFRMNEDMIVDFKELDKLASQNPKEFPTTARRRLTEEVSNDE
jgi:hypothetical protein